MNGMTPKELEKEKMMVGRMCFDLKAKRQVSRARLGHDDLRSADSVPTMWTLRLSLSLLIRTWWSS